MVLPRHVVRGHRALAEAYATHVLDIYDHFAWRYLVNPGSVGQPRDGDPRASYAILDDETREITITRVIYPVTDASDRILAAGLPKILGHRLTLGR